MRINSSLSKKVILPPNDRKGPKGIGVVIEALWHLIKNMPVRTALSTAIVIAAVMRGYGSQTARQ